jgi:hypothetical protein
MEPILNQPATLPAKAQSYIANNIIDGLYILSLLASYFAYQNEAAVIRASHYTKGGGSSLTGYLIIVLPFLGILTVISLIDRFNILMKRAGSKGNFGLGLLVAILVLAVIFVTLFVIYKLFQGPYPQPWFN